MTKYTGLPSLEDPNWNRVISIIPKFSRIKNKIKPIAKSGYVLTTAKTVAGIDGGSII